MKWLAGILLICSSLFSDIIAIASDGNTSNSNISSQASRSDYYIFIDEKGDTLEVLNNSFKDIKGGASSKLIEMLKDKKVSHFIASEFGDKLERALDTNDIKHTIYVGSVKMFIEQEIKK